MSGIDQFFGFAFNQLFARITDLYPFITLFLRENVAEHLLEVNPHILTALGGENIHLWYLGRFRFKFDKAFIQLAQPQELAQLVAGRLLLFLLVGGPVSVAGE